MKSELEIYFEYFLDYQKSENNCSEATVKSYKYDFSNIIEFLNIIQVEPQINLITTAILRRFITFLKENKKFATNTVRRKIHCLASFFKYLIETEYIDKNPMAPIKAPKEEKKLPIYIKVNELQRLMDAPEKYARFPENRLRDKVMVELFIFTGGRRAEVNGLNFDDIDFGRDTITIRKGKGNKSRVIPLVEPLKTDLWNYLNERLPLTNRAIIISSRGTRMSMSNMHVLFKTYLKKCGLGSKDYSFHKCRHAFASLLHQQGVDLLEIKELLGHEDINTTTIYTHTNINHLKNAVEKFPLVGAKKIS
ncbi:tyrosine-type recombinase/integrase [Sedimentibacter hydroxybenzoicus DSM 7310]|uniref:Tyrosine-type recombinase/integrase n=1 Tax=Sedimentibacter hydroxybenzoicus DSM 7310 TaxID=1123245 RepID=A0A974BHY5_SEDHY|nr:tyrosine-type recombinase/integrase [Sedimentibacter hydroxybenzoicus]NYB73503.1 tyrosine-type recombinase/integrase [Sedimentibacter hydroxybenzoicus DSM 7310]